MFKLKFLSALLMLILGAYHAFAGGISSNGPSGPQTALIKKFITNVDVNKAAEALQSNGYLQMDEPSVMRIASDCLPTINGVAGRCVVQYLISVEFKSPNASKSEFVSATIVQDTYQNVPGHISESLEKFILPTRLEEFASSLKQ